MKSLQVRLLTILRNLDAPMTAAEIRDKCQLPQTLDEINRELLALERIGKARMTLDGRFSHRFVRASSDDEATESSPAKDSAPLVSGVSKTKQVLDLLRQRADCWSCAMTAREISEAFGGEISADRVSALLGSRRNAGKTPELQSRQAEGAAFEWVWIQGAAAPAEAPADPPAKPAQPVADAAPPVSEQSAAPAVDDIPSLTEGDLGLLSDLDAFEQTVAGHPVRDAEKKIMAVERVARVSPPNLAALLYRVIDEDLRRGDASPW